MDVTLLLKNSIKIKAKNASLVVDPTGQMKKTNADGILSLKSNGDIDASKVEGFRVLIEGPGEYEIGGIRITTQALADKLIYSLDIGSIGVLLGNLSALGKTQNGKAYKILILNSDLEIDQSIISSFESSVVILYGEMASVLAKEFGKEITSLQKFSVSEKLPEEMEVVVLG